MTITGSGEISLSDLATEFGGTQPHSLSEYYKGGANVTGNIDKSITYTQIKGNNGSPSIGTQDINDTSFSKAWHNRTFSGDQEDWGTSMVRETDNQVAYCKTEDVNAHRLGWRWSAGISGYTQNPYYFMMKITGKHRTSETGTFLTGTHYYTGFVDRNDGSQGDQAMSRRSGNPGNPNATSVNNGSTTEAEADVDFIYDMIDCDIEFYFNANEPNTSSAAFRFHFDSNDDGNVGNNQQGVVNDTLTNVPESGAVSLTDYYGGEDQF